MLVQIHLIRNFSPSNLNRDDLGSPKTCYFGGTLRARISSQCIKRSIRRSEYFQRLMGGTVELDGFQLPKGGVRTRRLLHLVESRVKQMGGPQDVGERAKKILKKLKVQEEGGEGEGKMIIFTTWEAIEEMARLFLDPNINDDSRQEKFKRLIAEKTAAPDIALSGRMLETGEIPNTRVEAALQAAHALSTHTVYPEVDYFVAADDIPGEDAGAAHLGELLYTSACFYQFFSIDWNQLLKNLNGFPGNKEHLAAHTVGAFLQAAALVTPTGKQNSFAAHNPASGVMVELRDGTPISYANAFVKPVEASSEQDLVARSIAQLAHYVRSVDEGFGKPRYRAWFSPGMLHPFAVDPEMEKGELLPEVSQNFTNLEELVRGIIKVMGYDWEEVRRVTLYPEE